jgi:hypothetical protein
MVFYTNFDDNSFFSYPQKIVGASEKQCSELQCHPNPKSARKSAHDERFYPLMPTMPVPTFFWQPMLPPLGCLTEFCPVD